MVGQQLSSERTISAPPVAATLAPGSGRYEGVLRSASLRSLRNGRVFADEATVEKPAMDGCEAVTDQREDHG